MHFELLAPKALRAALIKRMGEDAVPTERQVRRWISGDTPIPGWARREIEALVGDSGHDETAPPWAERLLSGVMALETKGEARTGGLAGGALHGRDVLAHALTGVRATLTTECPSHPCRR